MLSQLVDIFDDSTWLMIFVVGWGSPLIGVMIALLWPGRVARGDVARAVLFYMLVGGAVLTTQDSVPSAFFSFGLCIVGSILAAVTILRAAKANSSRRNEHQVRAFPVLPVQQPSGQDEHDW